MFIKPPESAIRSDGINAAPPQPRPPTDGQENSPNRHTRRKLAALTRSGDNARQDLGSEDDARSLWRSCSKRLIHPFLVTSAEVIIDGNRRHWGAELEGALDQEVDCIEVDHDITPVEIRKIQIISAVHRSPLSEYDKAQSVRILKGVGMTGKQIAEDLVLHSSQITRLDSLFDCPHEVQQAAKEGKIGTADWYAISRASDPLAALQLKLGGASAKELDQYNKGNDKAAPPVVSEGEHRDAKSDQDNSGGGNASLRIDFPGRRSIIIKGVSTLPDLSTLLGEATRAVDGAVKNHLSPKSFVSGMSDMAKKPRVEKPAKKPRAKKATSE